jgi:adenine-specific DNA-methyltransferase
MGTKPTAIKKRRGVFYTPTSLSGLVADWAIRTADERVLEPSFGGCNFLSAMERRLTRLGSTKPWEQIFGCDIEATAFTKYLNRLIPDENSRRNFLKADFLTLTPDSFDGLLFHAALGNPPYVSYHNMFKIQRAAAARIGFDTSFRVPLTANLWSHFVFHSLRFLAPTGRMAWVLPSSILHAEYGRALLDELRQRFGRVAIISLEKKVFGDTTEKSEVLLCDRFGEAPRPFVDVATAKTLTSCASLLGGWNEPPKKFVSLRSRAVPSLISRRRLAAFRRIAHSSNVTRLGDQARLAIGVVTGANKVFVVSDEIVREHQLPEMALTPIFAKLEISRGLMLRRSDFRVARKTNIRCLLVDASNNPIPRQLKRYFSKVPVKVRKKNVTFRKRPDWRVPDSGAIPNAFLGYMHHNGPRLMLNNCAANSTNTIHRVYFRPEVTLTNRRLLAISMVSTFSQLSAEIEGRAYGSGVLKHELREAGRIQLLVPQAASVKEIRKVFLRIDDLFRDGKRAAAQRIADSFLAKNLPRLITREALEQMRQDLLYLRQRRQKTK